MGWGNPPIPWAELERRLSGRQPTQHPGDGGDSPAWSRKRAAFTPGEVEPPPGDQVPYAELHCHSNYSFLDGASHPEELAEEAVRLGLTALALTDHDGMYGVVRFAEAAAALGLPTLFGAELSLDLPGPQNGEPDPAGEHLLVLARGAAGYARLCRTLSTAHLAGEEKGRPRYDRAALGEAAGGHWLVLTGCRKGAVPRALAESGPPAAAAELEALVDLFGRENVVVELWDHGDPLDSDRNDALAALAAAAGLPTVATNNVHFAGPARRPLAAALAAVRARRSLAELEGWLPAAGTAHLRSGAEMAARFARYPGAVERAAAIAEQCAFRLELVAPNLPDFPIPPGHTEASWLTELVTALAETKYRPGYPDCDRAWRQIEHELDMIVELDFPGYFLIVRDIVEFCQKNGILVQGRGSAANSAVCYSLGITAVDAVRFRLLFERFLAPERGEPPDIDLDIEADRREEVIQYVYARYGRENAAQVANVITYRPRSAIRDMARALGYAPGQQDAWAKQIEFWDGLSSTVDHDIPADVVALATQVSRFPRHLGIHSGGMVICDRPVVEVCPVEWARMDNRTVLQWDKDDCAAIDLVKFDLLGLGMLSVLHYAFDLVEIHHGVALTLSTVPPEDPAVYEMLCRADSVGVFQVESRAQMATLPRLRPRKFYDLVVEVALIRPGPIQGGSVHPYIRRRNGLEQPAFLHPLLEPALGKTLGVPLFQEQLMQMAIDVAGCSAAEADQLRRAMGSKRSPEKMARLKGRLYEGMAANRITGAVADEIYDKLAAFANFGFPESHAVSFAHLVYASSYLKHYYPAAFCAALLNAQPMGFYSPQSLVADARRHGVTVRGPDVAASAALAILEPPVADGGQPVVRLGLGSVRTIGAELAEQIEAGKPYADPEDLARRVGLTTPQVEALATAGAFGCFGLDRRSALWGAGAVAQAGGGRLEGTVIGAAAPTLPEMTEVELAVADVWATGVTPDDYPTRFLRPRLDALGIVTAAGLRTTPTGTRVTVGGVVTHRQRPATAGGVTFLNLEDETGMVNVICSPGVWARHRRVARGAGALLVRGRLEKVEGVINVIAERFAPLAVDVPTRSRDFR